MACVRRAGPADVARLARGDALGSSRHRHTRARTDARALQHTTAKNTPARRAEAPYHRAVFSRILIARRSVAALRVTRTCQRLGIATVGIATEGSDDTHLEGCENSVTITVTERKAWTEELIAAAKEIGVDAVHPGFIDDTTDVELARSFEAQGLSYVGLDPDVIDTLDSRRAFRETVERAGGPCVPSCIVASLPDAYEGADTFGLPARFVDGKGTFLGPVIDDEDELEGVYESVRGQVGEDTELWLEHWFDRSRAIEVLVAADSEGLVEPIIERETKAGV